MAQLNNLIVTGSARFLNKINGTCTDGTAGTTKYMRQDGTWQTPPDNNNAVTQTATSTNATYEVLFSVTADNTTRTEGARKNSNLTFNPSTGALTATKLTLGAAPSANMDAATKKYVDDNVTAAITQVLAASY